MSPRPPLIAVHLTAGELAHVRAALDAYGAAFHPDDGAADLRAKLADAYARITARSAPPADLAALTVTERRALAVLASYPAGRWVRIGATTYRPPHDRMRNAMVLGHSVARLAARGLVDTTDGPPERAARLTAAGNAACDADPEIKRTAATFAVYGVGRPPDE